MDYRWNWNVLFELAPSGANSYLVTLIYGAWWTVVTALSSFGLALVLGAMVGMARTSDSPVFRAVAAGYVEVFRNIPLIVQMFLWYFVLPEMLPREAGIWLKQLSLGPVFMAIAALSFYTSVRVAEQLRSAIESRPQGQRDAAMALGLTPVQTYRFVILPVAWRIIIPPLTSEFIGVVKNSAIALTIGVVELTASARIAQELTFQVFEIFTIASLFYLTINFMIVHTMAYVEKKAAVPGFIGGKHFNENG